MFILGFGFELFCLEIGVNLKYKVVINMKVSFIYCVG